MTSQRQPYGFTEKVYDLPGKILWLRYTSYQFRNSHLYFMRLSASVDNAERIHGKQVISPCKTAAAED